MATAIVIGSSGGVGQHIFDAAIQLPAFGAVHAFSRREFLNKYESLNPIISSDPSGWPSHFPKLGGESRAVLFSGLGTARSKEHRPDHDLYVELAKVAKGAGVRTYVLISTASPSKKTQKLSAHEKDDVEAQILKLRFDHTIIVRLGFISGVKSEGSRPLPDEGAPAEGKLKKAASVAAKFGIGFKDYWSQDSEDIARAAVVAAIKAEQGDAPHRVWTLTASDIVRLGRSEWGTEQAAPAQKTQSMGTAAQRHSAPTESGPSRSKTIQLLGQSQSGADRAAMRQSAPTHSEPSQTAQSRPEPREELRRRVTSGSFPIRSYPGELHPSQSLASDSGRSDSGPSRPQPHQEPRPEPLRLATTRSYPIRTNPSESILCGLEPTNPEPDDFECHPESRPASTSYSFPIQSYQSESYPSQSTPSDSGPSNSNPSQTVTQTSGTSDSGPSQTVTKNSGTSESKVSFSIPEPSDRGKKPKGSKSGRRSLSGRSYTARSVKNLSTLGVL